MKDFVAWVLTVLPILWLLVGIAVLISAWIIEHNHTPNRIERHVELTRLGYSEIRSVILEELRKQPLSWHQNSDGLQQFIKKNRVKGRLVFIPDNDIQ